MMIAIRCETLPFVITAAAVLTLASTTLAQINGDYVRTLSPRIAVGYRLARAISATT
jgi:hypothetical protein